LTPDYDPGVERAWTVLGAWSFDPVPLTAVVVAAALYLWGVRNVRRSSRPAWPWWVTASFLSGLATVAIAIVGPFGVYDDTFFWAHMVQHMLLMMVGAPLIILGAPVLLLLRVSSRQTRHDWIVPVLRSRIVTVLTNPVVSGVLLAVVIMGTHFTAFFDYALQHDWFHNYVEHTLYLGAALLYFYTVLPGNPSRQRLAPGWRVLSLFLIMVPESMTGFFIYTSRYLLYPFYGDVSRPFGPGPIADQRLAGGLMWSMSMLTDFAWVSVAVMAWLHSEQRKSYRLDLDTLAKQTRPVAGPP
jgi:cytochrome c oxidase assembly factor CtaG